MIHSPGLPLDAHSSLPMLGLIPSGSGAMDASRRTSSVRWLTSAFVSERIARVITRDFIGRTLLGLYPIVGSC